MRLYICLLLVLLTACATTTQPTQPTPASPSRAETDDQFPDSAVPYPANFPDDFSHYLTVDRPDGTVRDIYINADAVAELRQGRPLPQNTVIVVDGFHAAIDAEGQPVLEDGRYVKAAPLAMLHVAHRRANWADSDFPSIARNGQWNFGSFDVETGERFDEDLVACFNCHQTMADTDFLYSTDDLLRYIRTDDTQYEFCNLRRRVPC